MLSGSARGRVRPSGGGAVRGEPLTSPSHAPTPFLPRAPPARHARGRRRGARRRPDPDAAHPHRQRHADRLRLRQQYLDRRTRAGGTARRLTSFQGQTTNPHFSPDGKWIAFSAEYAGNTDVYVVPAEGGEPKRLTWHPGADKVAGLDARRQVDSLRLGPRHRGAQRRAAVLDGPRRRRRRRAAAAASRLPGQDLPRRHAHRLSHEQFLGRRAPQLPRRPEPPHLDRRSEDLRPGLASVDRFQRHGPGVGGRHGVLHLRPRRRGQRLVVRHEDEEAGAGHRSSPTST